MASLGKLAISSVKWTTLQTAASGITGLILLVVKARFLSPEEFGYIAVILIAIGLFQLLESFGISQAVIQRDEINVQESSTLFYFNIIFSFFLAALLYAVSPYAAVFFSLPALEDYLRMACIIILISGPSLLFRAFLEKRMFFKELSIIAMISNIIVLGITTFFLVSGLGVLGVIYAQIIGAALSTLSVLAITVRFRLVAVPLYFNPVKLLPFLRFGVFVSAKQFMTFAAHRLDEVIIGFFLTPEILGIYHFGKNMLEKLRTLMTMSFGKVLFPVLSRLKHQPQKLTFAYHRVSRYIAFGAFPIFTGIAVTAHLFVPLVFGEQWLDSVVVFQVFSLAVILLALTANVSTSLLYAVNRPDLVFYIDVLTNALYFFTLLLFADRGMLAVLIAYSCYVIYKTLFLQYHANGQLVDGFPGYLRELAMPGASAMFMAAAVLSFQMISSPLFGPVPLLAGSIIIGALVYIAMVVIFARETLIQLESAIIKGEIVR